MKTVYEYHYEGDEGEIEAMFSDTGEMLSYWFCNDAMWRQEYFGGFMEKMGVKVKRPTATMEKSFKKILEKEVSGL